MQGAVPNDSVPHFPDEAGSIVVRKFAFAGLYFPAVFGPRALRPWN